MSVVSVKRAYVMDYLCTNPCVDCGEVDPIVLEFDHQRDKRYNISKLITNNCSLKRLVLEIDKCQVRCANCHRRKTASTYGNYKLETLEELQSRVVPQKLKKLSKKLADEIRARYAASDSCGYRKLAKEYGVCRSTVRDIIAGAYYR